MDKLSYLVNNKYVADMDKLNSGFSLWREVMISYKLNKAVFTIIPRVRKYLERVHKKRDALAMFKIFAIQFLKITHYSTINNILAVATHKSDSLKAKNFINRISYSLCYHFIEQAKLTSIQMVKLERLFAIYDAKMNVNNLEYTVNKIKEFIQKDKVFKMLNSGN